MKALIRSLGVFIVVAILTLPTSAVIFAQGDEDWAVYMHVTTDPNIGSIPGEGYHFGFGVKGGAMDGYNSGEGDKIAPPDPQRGIAAYFYYPSNPSYQDKLIVSTTGPAASVTWPLRVKMVENTDDTQMTISWPDISSVPAKYNVLALRDTGNITLADMKSVDHYTLPASEGQTYDFNIIAISEETPVQYNLAISSTAGGSVIKPSEGTFAYDEGTVVDLTVAVEESSRFVKWTGDVDTIADANDAATNITMYGDYSIRAIFSARVNYWPFIGGIIGAVVVAGLVMLFVRRRKAASTTGR